MARGRVAAFSLARLVSPFAFMSVRSRSGSTLLFRLNASPIGPIRTAPATINQCGYSKGQKNDFRDAEAIAEAVQRPTMKFVATQTADQLDLQALHRVRERLVRQRTGIINQIRAFLLERSIAVRQGIGFLRAELPQRMAHGAVAFACRRREPRSIDFDPSASIRSDSPGRAQIAH